MSNSKYSNILTVFLIIAIIGIIGLLVFLGIDAYNKINLDKDRNEGVAQFDQQIPNIYPNTSDFNLIINGNDITNSVNNTIIEDPFSSNTIENNETNNSSQTSTSKKVMFKGFVQVGNISIPSTNLTSPILESAIAPALEVAVAIQAGPGLNQVGNTVIAGHNYHDGSLFSNNKNIKLGDKIYIKDTSGLTVTYVTYEKYEITENDASYLTRDTNGKREITLYSCNDDSSMRIIIHAREQ